MSRRGISPRLAGLRPLPFDGSRPLPPVPVDERLLTRLGREVGDQVIDMIDNITERRDAKRREGAIRIPVTRPLPVSAGSG